MKGALKLSPTFSLPLEAATRRMAIVAMSGAGKSNLAVVMAEEMYKAGIPWVAIDGKGDWYGIRSAKDGKRPGLPIPVFGGLHGDVPLEPTAGKMMAELIASKRLTCVLDVSEFDTREQMFAFLKNFAEMLLRKNKEPLHLFCEEADDYIPQKTGTSGGGVGHCLGAWQRLVKRGRFRGIGATLITQRTASINKDVLNMAEVLFPMRVTGPIDRKAIVQWVVGQGLGKEIVDELPKLKDGEAFAWSPAWLETSERFMSRRRATFDSGKTPEIGASVEPAKLADIDLGEIKEQMAATIKRADAENPAKLQQEIRRLNKEIADQTPVSDDQAIKGAVATERRRGEAEIREIKAAVQIDRKRLIAQIRAYAAVFDVVNKKLAILPSIQEQVAQKIADAVVGVPDGSPMSFPEPKPAETPTVATIPAPPIVQARPVAPTFANNFDSDLPGPEQRVIDGLAELKTLGMDSVPRILVALMAGYRHPRSKGFTNALGSLRTSYLIEYPESDRVSITDSGTGLANAGTPPTTLDELHDRVMQLFDNVQVRLLKPLIEHYPTPLSRDDLAPMVGYEHVRSKGYTNTLGRCRSLGLIEYPSKNMVVATKVLFPSGLS